MKKILIIIVMLNTIIFALDGIVLMDIPLKNNTYTIKSNCSYSAPLDGYNSIFNEKKYEFIFESEEYIFENYNLFNIYSVVFITDLYTINPSLVYANDKLKVHIILSEEDFKKIFESSSVKITFKPELFSHDLIDKVYKKHVKPPSPIEVQYGVWGIDIGHEELYPELYVKPYIRLSLDQDTLNRYLNECDHDYNKYLEECNTNKKKKKTRNYK